MLKLPVILTVCLLFLSCGQRNGKPLTIEGKAQGTYYRIQYYDDDDRNLRKGIDSIFNVIDFSLSLHNPQSIICGINQNKEVLADRHFIAVLSEARQIAAETDGYFDYTLRPLTDAWKKLRKAKKEFDQAAMDSLKQFTGWYLVAITNGSVVKKTPEVTIDLNAIAQGYTVDVLADYLMSNGIENFIVELGGEVKAHGKKNSGVAWNAGIEKPPAEGETARNVIHIVGLENKALATSGSYHQFYIKDGVKYSHIINPKTCCPVRHSMLSVTVMAGSCSTADAYATAFMAMGLDLSVQFLKKHKELKAFFIYSDSSGSFLTLDLLR